MKKSFIAVASMVLALSCSAFADTNVGGGCTGNCPDNGSSGGGTVTGTNTNNNTNLNFNSQSQGQSQGQSQYSNTNSNANANSFSNANSNANSSSFSQGGQGGVGIGIGGNANASGGTGVGIGGNATGGNVNNSGNSSSSSNATGGNVSGSGNSSSSSSAQGGQGGSSSANSGGNVMNGGDMNVTTNVRPAASAPANSLTSVGTDNCLGSVSGSFGNGFISFGGGTTTESAECNRRANSRRLEALGYREAAVALQCMNDEVREAMKIAGTPCPQEVKKAQQ